MIREPAVAGLFYPESPEDLKHELKRYVDQVPKKKYGKILGIISPHAGYEYSGKAAAYAHKALADSGYPETLILLGPSHTAGINSVWLGSDWATPIGKIEVDRDLGREISKNKIFDIDPDPHFQEHSLEVQLPFIQYLSKGKPPKIVPILFSSQLDAELAEKFADAILSKTKGKNVKFVVSSDFTHYGMNYGYIPFIGDAKNKIYELDRRATEKIEKLDLRGFVEYVNETGATICGAFPIAVAIEIAKKSGLKNAKLLDYYTSGDLTHSYSNSVSYASLYF